MSENPERAGGGAQMPQRWEHIGAGDGFVLPVGTVSLLLADVEGSTKLWQTHGDEMPARMAALDELVDDAVALHSGVRPVEQGEGDNFVAAFSKATDAVACALDVQQRMRAVEEDGGPDQPVLRYRMGIHAGEVSVHGEGKYSGAFINRTARLRDIGHGGQVLLSRVAAELVADALPEGADLLDLGQHRLRDLTRPEQVFQLTHPDLRSEFPSLRGLDSLPHNLPVQLASFVGRDSELTELAQVLQRDTTRLLTLTGSGGCGKTRLALEVAAAVMEAFPDGVWFVELAALSDDTRVPDAAGAAVGLREQPGGPGWTAQLVEHLAAKQCLVLLDNCEHLVEACASLVDELLRRCPGLVVLATSREPLGVTGEVNWRVPSLATPGRDTPIAIDALPAFDAVRLFIDRARQARPNFEVTAENAPAIADICARLDGIPLAIELAAARVRVLGVVKIAAGLNDRFRLLGGGVRTAMPRQQTLLASVAWSYDLLGEQERAVLRRLAVFAGVFDLDAAEFVAAGDGIEEHEILELLTQLVDRSLVQADDSGGGPVRYRLLETMRQFSSERLIESGEAAAARDRHLAWYESLVDSVWVEQSIRRATSSVDLGEEGGADFNNIREALGWALANPERREAGLRLIGNLWLYFMVRGGYAEGRRWAEDLLAAAPDADPAARGVALNCHAFLCGMENDFMSSVASAQEAASIARTTGDKRLLGQALSQIGWPLGLFDYAAARTLLLEGVEVSREVGDRRTAGMCLFFLAFHEGLHGELVASRRHFDESITERDLAVGTLERAHVETGIALVAGWQGEIDLSLSLLGASIPVFDKVADPYWRTLSRVYAAMTHLWAGHIAEAREAIDDAVVVSASLASPAVVLAHAVAPALCLGEGRLDDVGPAADVALPNIGGYGPSVGRGVEAQMRAAVAVARLAGHDEAGAAQAAAEALDVARAADNPTYSAAAMIGVVTVLLTTDELAAEQCAHDALSMSVDSGVYINLPPLLEALGAVARRQESHSEAVRLFAAANAARTRQGTQPIPRWNVDVDAEFVALREAIGEESFDAAWADGSALSLDDAVAYARRGRGERKRPSSGWASLTPTESQVVELVADGLSNPEIAERLFMSRRTVASHLTHVFAKVDVKTRNELTALVVRKRASSN